MLKITVPPARFWNSKTEKFEYTKETTLVLEHSLISLSKWEAKFHKPYFNQAQKTDAEARYYVKCMTINDIKDERVYYALNEDNVNAIYDYIHNPMTATVIEDDASNKKKKKRKVPKDKREITSELVYYWMIQYNIPHEYEKWHFERLLTLIRLCDEENRKAQEKEKKKKEQPKTTTQQLDAIAALNERRKAALHTKG